MTFSARSIALAICVLTLPLRVAVAQQQEIPPDSPLPIDPRVTLGTLDNGLRYYIRENGRPENRAELRLVVNAGSVLEDEDQRGLAHVVEHMAFNGTTNFERQELVEYLEGIGMRFGPDINAYTSFDETVYMLTIPTDDQEVMGTAFQILEDWATGVIFDPDEIEKERGVVIEEWRGGRGAQARILDLQVPVLLEGSRYAERLPIGLRETLETFSHEALTRFYERWYRPDLMSVVAVGDFDPAEIEALIERHFAPIPVPESGADRPLHEVPEHGETRFQSVSDPELTNTSVQILHKQPAREPTTVADYRQLLVEHSFNGMLNARLAEITQKPNAPFMGAFSSRSGFVRSSDMYALGAVVPDGGAERGLEAVLTEAERVAQHGFTATELERQKLNLLRGLERAHAERERTNSNAYASEYVRHYLTGEPIPGISFEYETAQRLVPGIRLEEIDRLAREWITEENRVILVSAPEQENVALPAEAELRQVLAGVGVAEIEPYEDTVADQPLVAEPPEPAEIVEEVRHDEVDVLEWRLANGVRVLLKPTDFQDDQILLSAYSPGGLSLASDEEFLSASFAANVVQASGVGAFSMVDLRRVLAGKAASVSPSIRALEQQFNGNASPSDVETLFQLVYLYFTAPREDAEAVQALLERQRALLANRSADPEAVFSDTLQVTLNQHHPRSRPLTTQMLEEVDVGRAHAFYRERFADASGFTFVLVGNLDIEALTPLIQTYLGALPSAGQAEDWRDTGIRPPEGVVEKVVRQGLEPRSMTRIVFTRAMEGYTREDSYALQALTDVLRIRLRDVLREDLGGTYGVQVSGSSSRRPDERQTLNIHFGAAPERLDELVAVVFEEIERLKADGPRPQDLTSVKEIHRRDRERNLKENGFWVRQLVGFDRQGLDFADILDYERLIDGLTPETVRDAANTLLRADNYVRVSLLPAEES